MNSSKWLGVTFDQHLNFKQHRLDVVAKGLQRAGFIASLSHAQWGIPPKLVRTLLSTTVHTATDYGAAAWLPFEPPLYFVEKLSTVDLTCARAALGALRSTPTIFLTHDLKLTNPSIRLQMKTLAFIAKTLTKPTHHPLHRYVSQARASKVTCHHNPFNRFFQSQLSEEFDDFTQQKTIDPHVQLSRPQNYATLILKDEEKAAQAAKCLKHSSHHLIVYTDGSHLPKEYTGAAAWCSNANKSISETLGPARLHGIFEAEYRGLHLGLTLALRHSTPNTRIASILLDNQGVILDMQNQKQSISSIIDKQRTYTILNYLYRSYPGLKVVVRWCPGHKGIPGNERVDKLAKKAAATSPANTDRKETGLAAFMTAIKAWGKTKTNTLNPAERKRLGHDPRSDKHLKAISKLPKHSVAAITQLRSNHVQLNQHLHKMMQVPEPVCDCQTGIESPDHFLFICPRYTHQREALLTDLKSLKLPANTSVLNEPTAYPALATFCEATWRFKNRWVWASIIDEPLPTHLHPPDD